MDMSTALLLFLVLQTRNKVEEGRLERQRRAELSVKSVDSRPSDLCGGVHSLLPFLALTISISRVLVINSLRRAH